MGKKKGIGKTIPFSPELTTPSQTALGSPIQWVDAIYTFNG
jgi:hypothetical protein